MNLIVIDIIIIRVDWISTFEHSIVTPYFTIVCLAILFYTSNEDTVSLTLRLQF